MPQIGLGSTEERTAAIDYTGTHAAHPHTYMTTEINLTFTSAFFMVFIM